MGKDDSLRLFVHSSMGNRGSVFFAIFAAVAMVGILGVATMNLMRGPVRAMSEVTKRTVAENNMIASGKLALIMSAEQIGDCDNDGIIEPIEWTEPAGRVAPMNGGLLPSNIGASLQDPWGNPYGYCVWDHGPQRGHADCGAGARRLEGEAQPTQLVIAILSAGPDRIYQTGCQPQGHADFLLRIPGSDDVVLAYSYGEALVQSGGLWNLKIDDADTATIAKNLTVTDEHGTQQLSFDAASGALALGASGTGELPNIKTDYIQNLTANAPVEFLSSIKTGAANIETSDANAVAAIVTSSGGSGIGLKAHGTSKAIESEGILDMTTHKIINLAAPTNNTDAATKKYVDDKVGGASKIVRCEAFVFSGCSGGTTQNLDTSSLGDCKKACQDAGVTCCAAQYGSLASNPNAALSQCVGHAGGKPTGSLVNLLAALLFPANIGAYCYEQY